VRLVTAIRFHALIATITDSRAVRGVIASPERTLVTAGFAVYGLSWCAADGADRRSPSLVVGYGGPPGHAFTTAVARLCAALSA
jgi:hypothetical protein